MEDQEMSLLRERIDQGFEDIHRRLDDQREVQTERHVQNTSTISSLDRDVRGLTTVVSVMNGTVTSHTKDLTGLLSKKSVTVGDLRLYAGIGAGAVAGFVWLLHTLGLLK